MRIDTNGDSALTGRLTAEEQVQQPQPVAGCAAGKGRNRSSDTVRISAQAQELAAAKRSLKAQAMAALKSKEADTVEEDDDPTMRMLKVMFETMQKNLEQAMKAAEKAKLLAAEQATVREAVRERKDAAAEVRGTSGAAAAETEINSRAEDQAESAVLADGAEASPPQADGPARSHSLSFADGANTRQPVRSGYAAYAQKAAGHLSLSARHPA